MNRKLKQPSILFPFIQIRERILSVELNPNLSIFVFGKLPVQVERNVVIEFEQWILLPFGMQEKVDGWLDCGGPAK